MNDYVKTGKVRYEYRDDAFIGEESKQAAEAAACALDQGAFWPYHDTLFANQGAENQGAYSAARLREMARTLGLDQSQFDTCLNDRTHQAEVAAMAAEALKVGVQRTPSFVVNGKLVEWTGYDDLAAAIDAALAAK